MANRQRDFWDSAAKASAAFYVDTTVSYDNPDMDAFFATGKTIVDQALAPVAPAGRSLAVEIGSGLGRNCLALAERFDRGVGSVFRSPARTAFHRSDSGHNFA